MKRLNKDELALSQTLVKTPFDFLIAKAPVNQQTPVAARVECLGEILDGLKGLESQCQEVEKTNAILGLSGLLLGGIAVSSCAALGVIGAAVVPVVAGAGLLGLFGSAGSQQAKIMKLDNRAEKIRLAIMTSPLNYWAALWELVGTELFLSAVEDAADCTVVDSQVHYVGDSPLAKAILKASLYKGWSYDQLFDAIEGVAQQAPMTLPTNFTPATERTLKIVQNDVPSHLMPLQQEVALDRLQTPSLSAKVDNTPPLVTVASEIVDLILQCTQSLVFIGGQRCGKSMLMAIASLIGLQTGRYSKVSVVSSLTKAGEDANYWKHCTTQAFYDLKAVEDKTPYYEKYIEVIREFKQTATAEEPQLLIIDEFAFLAQCLSYDGSKKGGDNKTAQALTRLLMELGSVISSATEKNGWYVWFGSPRGDMGSFGDELRSVVKSLTLCYCAIAPDAQVKTSTGGTKTWEVELYDAAKRNWTVLENNMPPRGAKNDLGERIVQFNGKWYKSTSYTLQSKEAPVDQRAFKEEVAKRDSFSPVERGVLDERVATLTLQEKVMDLLQTTSCRSFEEFVTRDMNVKPSETQRAIEAVKCLLDQRDAWKLARQKNWV